MQVGGPGTPAKMFGRPMGCNGPGSPSSNVWEPEGLPEIFPRAQPCSPVIIGSMIHNMLLLNVEVHFLRTLVKGMQILVNYPYS